MLPIYQHTAHGVRFTQEIYQAIDSFRLQFHSLTESLKNTSNKLSLFHSIYKSLLLTNKADRRVPSRNKRFTIIDEIISLKARKVMENA